MAILLNRNYPEFKILVPATGEWIQFRGGKLEIDKDDPSYDVVMAEATRNPSIVVYESVTTCEACGEAFSGKAAAAQLGKHRKDAHFELWLADQDGKAAEKRQAEIVKREGVACDVCRPPQVFADEDALAIHTQVVHIAVPELDENGNLPSEAQPFIGVPAATPSET